MAFANDLYVPFIEHCFVVLGKRLPHTDNRDQFLKELQEHLTTAQALRAVDAAEASANPVTGHFLKQELAYLLRLSGDDLRSEDAETAKESLKSWLSLPDWLDGPLDVLDELLKIGSGRD